MKKSCKDCQHSHVALGAPIQCRFNPPAANPVIMRGAPTPGEPGGALMVQLITAFPQVQDSDWCGQHRARLSPLH